MDYVSLPQNDFDPKCSVTQNFTPGVCQASWASAFLFTQSQCSMSIYTTNAMFIIIRQVLFFVLKMQLATKETKVLDSDEWGQTKRDDNA